MGVKNIRHSRGKGMIADMEKYNTELMQRYMDEVFEMKLTLEMLSEFFVSLPEPDDGGTLFPYSYGHIAAMSDMLRRVREMETIVADMWPTYPF